MVLDGWTASCLRGALGWLRGRRLGRAGRLRALCLCAGLQSQVGRRFDSSRPMSRAAWSSGFPRFIPPQIRLMFTTWVIAGWGPSLHPIAQSTRGTRRWLPEAQGRDTTQVSLDRDAAQFQRQTTPPSLATSSRVHRCTRSVGQELVGPETASHPRFTRLFAEARGIHFGRNPARPLAAAGTDSPPAK